MSLQSERVWRMFVRGFAGTITGISFFLVTAALSYGADVAKPEAPGFKTLPVNPRWLSTDTKDKTKARDVEDNIRKIINGAPIGDFDGPFDSYFTLVLFPKWTQTTEKNLNELPKERDKFVKNSLELSAKNPTVHAKLVDLTHRELSKIAQDEGFHPAVRYNAILIVGLLNETEPNRGTGVKQMPVPYIKALTTLMEELKKPGNNEAVRVGALLGVARHLEWDNSKTAMEAKIAPALRTEIINELNSIVATKIPPAGRSLEGQTWLRRRALEALGHAYALKVEPEFAKLLNDIITDDAEPISLRCTAADVMAHVDYPAAAPPSIPSTAKDLGYLALFACNSELLRLEGLKKYDERLLKVSGGAMGGGAMPGMSGGMPSTAGGAGMPGVVGSGPPSGAGAGTVMPKMPGMSLPGAGARGASDKGSKFAVSDPKQYRIDYSKRRLRAELFTVQLALGRKKDTTAKGLLAYAKAPADTTALERITKQVEAIIKIVEEQDQSAEDYDKGLRKEMRTLEGLTKPLPIAAKPETPKADVSKGPAAPGEEAPKEAKPAVEEPMEEIPTAPADKGSAEAGKAGAAPPAAGKAVLPAAEKGPPGK